MEPEAIAMEASSGGNDTTFCDSNISESLPSTSRGHDRALHFPPAGGEFLHSFPLRSSSTSRYRRGRVGQHSNMPRSQCWIIELYLYLRRL